MSTPSFQTGRRKIAPPFGGFTPAWGGEFSKSLFFVYAAQFLRWGSPLDTEEKKRISRGFGGEGPRWGPF
jgi:hypothetical protein